MKWVVVGTYADTPLVIAQNTDGAVRPLQLISTGQLRTFDTKEDADAQAVAEVLSDTSNSSYKLEIRILPLPLVDRILGDLALQTARELHGKISEAVHAMKRDTSWLS